MKFCTFNVLFSTSYNVTIFKSPLEGAINNVLGHLFQNMKFKDFDQHSFNQKYNKGRYNYIHGTIDDINLYIVIAI